jgi:hypothetical protein
MAREILSPQPRTWWRVPDNMNGVYPIKEAAILLNYSVNGLIYQIKHKYVVGFKISSRWFVVVNRPWIG